MLQSALNCRRNRAQFRWIGSDLQRSNWQADDSRWKM
jgi:hypothetical protein